MSQLIEMENMALVKYSLLVLILISLSWIPNKKRPETETSPKKHQKENKPDAWPSIIKIFPLRSYSSVKRHPSQIRNQKSQQDTSRNLSIYDLQLKRQKTEEILHPGRYHSLAQALTLTWLWFQLVNENEFNKWHWRELKEHESLFSVSRASTMDILHQFFVFSYLPSTNYDL
jgi:hypothetical protein